MGRMPRRWTSAEGVLAGTGFGAMDAVVDKALIVVSVILV
jgi:hypothetical protein